MHGFSFRNEEKNQRQKKNKRNKKINVYIYIYIKKGKEKRRRDSKNWRLATVGRDDLYTYDHLFLLLGLCRRLFFFFFFLSYFTSPSIPPLPPPPLPLKGDKLFSSFAFLILFFRSMGLTNKKKKNHSSSPHLISFPPFVCVCCFK